MRRIESKRKARATEGEAAYKAYRVTSPSHETKIVFAAGIWSAVGVLLQWRTANGIGQVGFNLDPEWAASLTGVARQHLDDARSWCRGPSIGARYRADVGWALKDPAFTASR